MKRLILMRHSQSLGNKLGIIQGPTNDYELTHKGIEEVYKTFYDNKRELDIIKRIVSSPLKRALQTAQVINMCYGKEKQRDILTNDLLTEFNAGLLSGMKKLDAEKIFPEYYKIWTDRKDLDGIPGAESGEKLQARAISFLMDYYDRDEYSELVITHAGFLRCLLNTIKGIYRTTPVEVKNAVLHIIEDPFENLNIIRKIRAMSSKVYIVETADETYVVKQKNRVLDERDRMEDKILHNLDKKIDNVPLILTMNNNPMGSVKIIKHIRGRHIYGQMTEKYENSFTDKVKLIHEYLQGQESSEYSKCNLLSILNEAGMKSRNAYVRKIAQSIIEDKRNAQKLMESQYCLVHSDLNRDNVLFYEDGEKIETNIIDWESIGLYPEKYQLASFLASGYLLENGNMIRAMQLAKRFEVSFDEDFILYLMKIRIFKGIYFFAEQTNAYVKSNPDVSNEILQKYIIAYSKIEKYMEDSILFH